MTLQPRTGSSAKISAIIACYKDGPAIPIMHRRLVEVFGQMGTDYEIIFVNDASPDETRSVLDELTASDTHVVAIHHSRNFGSQSAFTSGMRVATGDAVVLLDGDLQDPPELIPSFYEKWLEGYDVAYGERVDREASLLLRLSYKLFYRLFRAAAYVPVPVDAGDFSMLDRKVVDAMNSMPETNRFLRGLRAWVGFEQVGVPYVRPERMFGQSTNSLLKNFRWAQKAIFSFSYAPLSLIMSFALVTCAVAFGLIVVQVAVRILRPDLVPSGFTTLIVLILFVGGIQLLCLSIIGSYIEHIYDEVKRRPSFVVSEIVRGDDPVEDAPALRASEE